MVQSSIGKLPIKEAWLTWTIDLTYVTADRSR
jgi:hypothetical protein